MKTTRRNFIKMAGAAIAALFAPKSRKVGNVAKANEATIETDDFYDYLDGVVDAVEWRNSEHLEWHLSSDCGWTIEGDPAEVERVKSLLDGIVWYSESVEPGAVVYITHDKGKTWECVGEIV